MRFLLNYRCNLDVLRREEKGIRGAFASGNMGDLVAWVVCKGFL